MAQTMKAQVFVRIKPEVSDPQGLAICEALNASEATGISSVRVGKVFDLELEASDRESAMSTLDEIAERVLANPVVEEFSIELES